MAGACFHQRRGRDRGVVGCGKSIDEDASEVVLTGLLIGPPPLRGSFFLENGTLRDTREKNPDIGSKKGVTPSLF